MTDHLRLITNRRREVEQEIARVREHFDRLQEELNELDTTEKVLARLSGAERPSTSKADADESEEAPGAKPHDAPSIPDMITTVLTESHLDGREGMEPREITNVVRERWWPDVDGNRISSIAWRMKSRGQLEKDEGSSRYRLPREEKEAPDGELAGNTSEASQTETTAEGREAVPGGGT